MATFNYNEADFEAEKRKAEAFYETIGEVFCPYLKSKIAFNVKGIKHLKFKSDRVARTSRDQYARLKLLHLAPEILKLSHTLQGVWETRHFEPIKTNNMWKHLAVEVVFYEFIAVMNGIRAKVIVKQVEGGEKYFWSIIPYWGIDKERRKRIFHSGNPRED